MRKEYVSLNLENLYKVPVLQRHVPQTRSLRRYWRQLSRLQKNLIIFFTSLVLLFLFYSLLFKSQHILENANHDENVVLLEAEKYHDSIEVPQKDVKELDVDVNAVLEKDLNIDDDVSNEMKSKKDYKESLTARQKAVVNAAKHAWNGYKKYAWGHDHLRPISMTYQDWFHLGLTIVDSLDTLYIMNLTTEFKEARNWVETDFTFDRFLGDVNLFEVTIRILGGLLSAYHFSKDELFLEKAVDLGERLLPCFTKSPSPIPFSDVNLASRIAHVPKWSPDSTTAEATALQLEFRELSRCTQEPKYEKIAFKVSEHVHKLQKPDGLVPIFINPMTGQFNFESEIKIGARGDSYYEYLLKQWIQTGKTIDFLKEDYIEGINGIQERLVKVTPTRKLVYTGELKARNRNFSPKMDHLICFLPGTLALGVRNGMPEKHMRLAEQLLNTCYHMYADQPTGLAPEISYFRYDQNENTPDMYVQQQDTHYLLRPEFIESLWAMYQITGNETYQTWGWQIFEAIERYAKVAGGYTSIGNVLDPNDTKPRDLMESFFMSETLKYFFLLFSSNRRLLDMEKFVMNSEGHPLPIHSS